MQRSLFCKNDRIEKFAAKSIDYTCEFVSETMLFLPRVKQLPQPFFQGFISPKL
jgi:hypothetical protein